MSTIVVHESDTESEALALQQLLEEAGVVCAITSHRDTAYPGIVDRVAGGFEIRVAPEERDGSSKLIEEFLAGQSVLPLEEAAIADIGARAPGEEHPPAGSAWTGGPWALRIAVAAALAWVAWNVFVGE